MNLICVKCALCLQTKGNVVEPIILPRNSLDVKRSCLTVFTERIQLLHDLFPVINPVLYHAEIFITYAVFVTSLVVAEGGQQVFDVVVFHGVASS